MTHRPTPTAIRRLGPSNIGDMRCLNALFAKAFDEPETYLASPPIDAYLQKLLSKPHIIALAAFEGGDITGGLVAYALDKFEQVRNEIYIYDLAVAERHRRKGIGTALIEALKPIARDMGAHVMFVQAAAGDPPAVALYQTLGTRQDVAHFDILATDRGK